ncbi:ESX secretion-associated protein EspG [Actinophytocola glycyrrhizae]|uniref:ESX secretion-associated protein EspG n=1 Tax=Actinophytocola glycyrrhizae TaxID=2044873 RepID=A0ABV9S236_9PSEU
MRTGREVELSVLPLLSLMQKENLGEPHAIFAGGERYVSPRFSAEAQRVVQRDLAGAGLGERADFDAFLDLVNVVQRADAEYYGWVTTADESYSVLVAAHGRSAVLVVRSGERVRFERCDLDRMIETLVWRLPDNGVAHGEPFSVRHNDFHAPRGRADGSVMRRSAAARPEAARRLDALLDARRSAVAKLYAARRDMNGVRQRSERWLTVLDLVDGRWALSVAQARGQRWIHVAPGTHQHIGDRVLELAR